MAKLGLRHEAISTQVVPRDRHAELLSAIALAGAGPGALRDRDPPPAAHRGARGRGAVPGGPEGLERDAAQAQPGRLRAHLRPRAGAARQRAGGARERRALARARHHALLAPSGSCCPDSTILLDQLLALTLRVVRGMTVHADRMLRQPRDHVRRAVLPARAARARRDRDAARRRVPDRPAARPAGVGHADAAARRCSSTRRSSIDLDEVFDYGYYVRHVPEVLARLEVIPSPS